MTIRPYRPEDAPALSELYRRSVEIIGAGHYGPDQVRVWASLSPTPALLDEMMLDGRIRLVAADEEDSPLAFADLETDGHIQFLYCLPEAAGQGVTAALLEELERQARRSGVTRIFAEASEPARRFFERQGYRILGRRDLEIAGVPIHNHAVEKSLKG